MAASRVACSSFDIGANAVITITKDKSSYTHTIKYKFGNASGTVTTKTTQTRIVWTPAAATLYAQIPNAVSGYGTITCETYDGNTLIGTTTAGFYAYAVKADCLPTVSATIEDTNPATLAVTGDKTKLICYISKPKVTLTEKAKNSASIKTRQIYNPVGLTATESPYTFDTVYSDVFKVKVTDSRGYTAEETYKTDFVLYDPCFFYSVAVDRKESTSTVATAILTGFCFNSTFGASNNALTIKYRYKSDGEYGDYVTIPNPTWNDNGTFSAAVDIPDLSLDKTYIFEFAVEDKLTSFSSEEVILGQSVGDIRIAKDYVQFKNSVYVGDVNNEAWRCFSARRKISGKNYRSNFGTGFGGTAGAAILELYETINNEEKQAGRIELRNDSHLYNMLTSMSFAEMMAMAPSNNNDNAQGYIILNAGSSSPILIMWGLAHVTPSGANIPTSKRVNFLNQFSGIPYVAVEPLSGVPVQVDTSANYVTETGFDIVLDRINTVTTSIGWFAIGNGSNALPE